MYESVIPIIHRSANGNLRIDGTGFVLRTNGRIYFITCAHTFNFQGSDEESFIVLNGAEVILSEENPKIVLGDLSNVMPELIDPKTPLFRGTVPDFLFMELEEELIEYFLFQMPSFTVGIDEPLRLVTHNTTSGEQRILQCKRLNLNESVTLPEPQLNGMLERTELIPVHIDIPAEEGHSGGPILNANDFVIGYLVQGACNNISIFKIEELPFNVEDSEE